MDKWNEIRTAYKLAKLGTLSATADDMGVHRSTVMRHIDALEDSLGITLFQRNDRGYIPTEAGLDIMRLGEVTDSHFSQLSSRLKSKAHTLEGTLTITIVSEMVGIILPAITAYQSRHPKMNIELIGDIRNFNLEYGEADIAIRGGDKPTTPDNIVLPLLEAELVLCVHNHYVAQHGMPTEATLAAHRFIALRERPAHLVWNEWIYHNIPEDQIVVSASNQQLLTHTLMAGCGIGVLPRQLVAEQPLLVEVPIRESWRMMIWVLVHRDMISMPKVKMFLDVLKDKKDWPVMMMKLMAPTHGQIIIDQQNLRQFSRRALAQKMTLVPQDAPISDGFSVADIVAMGRHPWRGRFQPFTDEDRACVDIAMDQTGVDHLATRSMHQLSGGERQRVIIARAIAQDTPIILLDEATANLDVCHQLDMLTLAKTLAKEGRLIIAAIHDLTLASRFCDRLMLLANQQLQADGPPEAVLTADNLRQYFRLHADIGRPPNSEGMIITALASVK